MLPGTVFLFMFNTIGTVYLIYFGDLHGSKNTPATNTFYSIMSQTVTSVTAALGKQFENLSRQSTLDSYGFSGMWF